MNFNEAVERIMKMIESENFPNLYEKDKKKFVMDALIRCRSEYKEDDVELAFAATTRFSQITLF